jgi:tetratricopeptide (TPR) repeat protein
MQKRPLNPEFSRNAVSWEEMDGREDFPVPLAAAEEPAAPAAVAGTNRINAKWFWAIAIGAIAILAFPLASHFLSNGPLGSSGQNLLQVSGQKFQAKQYQAAIDAAREYLKKNPGSSDAYNNLAVSYLELGQYEEATRDVLEALRLNPSNELAKRNLGWITSERARATGVAPPQAQAPPAGAATLLNASLRLYNEKRFAECKGTAEAALKIYPAYAEAYNNIAACEIELKHYDAAIVAAQEAIRLKPDFQLARNNLAWAIKVRDGK